jgi:fatty-acyl-CoA synthase
MPMTIDSVIRWWSRERADQVALATGDQRVTYGELGEWVGRVAADLVGHGVARGDRVCVYAPNCLEWCVSALATLRAGGVVCGINARMVPAEVAYLLGDYAPKVLVTDAAGRERLGRIGGLTSRHGEPVDPPRLLVLDEIAARRHGQPADVVREVDPEAPAVIVTTSGSTARPKGVMYSNHSVIDHISAFILEDPVSAQPVKMLVVAPFNTSAGGVLFIHSLLQGGTCFFTAEFDPAVALDVITRERVAIFCGAPIFLQRIADVPAFADADVSCIEVSYTGGAAVAPALLKTWADKGVIVRQMYGQTEAGGWGITNPRRYALSDPDRCGYRSPTRDVRIVDQAGNVLGPDQPGLIELRGPGQMLGYWNDPEATAATLVDGWLRTGDIGVVDDRGLLKFVDRAKDMIISGGLNVSAAEVERVVMECPGVEEVAVLAAPDERFGETPMAILYGAEPPAVDALVAHCNERLSSHKVPRYVVVQDEPLPRLPTGKIAKPALRSRYLAPDVALPPRVR